MVFAQGSRLPATPDSLFAHIKSSHPRLIINPGAIAFIQSQVKTNEDAAGALSFIRKQADSLLLAKTVSYNPINGSLLETSRMVLERIKVLALIANVDGNRKYAERALMELDAAARFPNWGAIHFLDVAEMAAAWPWPRWPLETTSHWPNPFYTDPCSPYSNPGRWKHFRPTAHMRKA
jgi:hypothetical protein